MNVNEPNCEPMSEPTIEPTELNTIYVVADDMTATELARAVEGAIGRRPVRVIEGKWTNGPSRVVLVGRARLGLFDYGLVEVME